MRRLTFTDHKGVITATWVTCHGTEKRKEMVFLWDGQLNYMNMDKKIRVEELQEEALANIVGGAENGTQMEGCFGLISCCNDSGFDPPERKGGGKDKDKDSVENPQG